MSCNQRFRLVRQLFRHGHGLVPEAAAGSSALCGVSPSAQCAAPGFGRTAIRGLIGPAGGGGLPRDKFPPNYQFDDGGFASPDGPSATEMVWPMSRRQHKFSGRLLNALESVIESDFHMVELCRSTGFTILEVRAAPDLRKAYVKWDAFPRRMKAAEAGLSRRMNRLRAMTSRKLGSKFMPWLEFRHDAPTEEQRETERVLRQVESELAAEGGFGGINYNEWDTGDGDQPREEENERWDEVVEEPNEPGRVSHEHSSSSAHSTFAQQGAFSYRQERPQEGAGATSRQRQGVDDDLADEMDASSRPSDASTRIGSDEAMMLPRNYDADNDADNDAGGEEEDEEEEGDSGDAGARIWDLMEEMAARGASEEEIRAEVQHEVRKALTGED